MPPYKRTRSEPGVPSHIAFIELPVPSTPRRYMACGRAYVHPDKRIELRLQLFPLHGQIVLVPADDPMRPLETADLPPLEEDEQVVH